MSTERFEVEDPESLKIKARQDGSEDATPLDIQARDYTRTQRYSVEQPTSGLHFTRGAWGGAPIGASEASAKDTAHLGTQATSVAAAERMGFIQREGDRWTLTEWGRELAGDPRYGDSPSLDRRDDPHASEDRPQVPEGEPAEVTRTIEQAVTLIGQLPPGVYESQAALALEMQDGRSVDAEALASDLGITPDQARSRYNAVVQGLQAEAASYLRSQHGVEDGNGFVAWAKANRAAEFRQAMLDHIRGDLDGYSQLATEFRSRARAVAHMDFAEYEGSHDVEGHDEPATVWTAKDGETYFHHPAVGSMLLSTAILRGIAREETR